MKNFNRGRNYSNSNYRRSQNFLSPHSLNQINNMVDQLLDYSEDPKLSYSGGYRQDDWTSSAYASKTNDGNNGRDPILDQILSAIHSMRDDYRRMESKLDRTLNIVHSNTAEIQQLKSVIHNQSLKIKSLEEKNGSVQENTNSERHLLQSSLLFNGELVKIPDKCSRAISYKCPLASTVRDVCKKELDFTVPSE